MARKGVLSSNKNSFVVKDNSGNKFYTFSNNDISKNINIRSRTEDNSNIINRTIKNNESILNNKSTFSSVNLNKSNNYNNKARNQEMYEQRYSSVWDNYLKNNNSVKLDGREVNYNEYKGNEKKQKIRKRIRSILRANEVKEEKLKTEEENISIHSKTEELNKKAKDVNSTATEHTQDTYNTYETYNTDKTQDTKTNKENFKKRQNKERQNKAFQTDNGKVKESQGKENTESNENVEKEKHTKNKRRQYEQRNKEKQAEDNKTTSNENQENQQENSQESQKEEKAEDTAKEHNQKSEKDTIESKKEKKKRLKKEKKEKKEKLKKSTLEDYDVFEEKKDKKARIKALRKKTLRARNQRIKAIAGASALNYKGVHADPLKEKISHIPSKTFRSIKNYKTEGNAKKTYTDDMANSLKKSVVNNSASYIRKVKHKKKIYDKRIKKARTNELVKAKKEYKTVKNARKRVLKTDNRYKAENFFKRQMMKRRQRLDLKKVYGLRFRDKIKRGIKNFFADNTRSSRTLSKKFLKAIGHVILALFHFLIIFFIPLIIAFILFLLLFSAGAGANITTYQSDVDVLKDIDSYYSTNYERFSRNFETWGNVDAFNKMYGTTYDKVKLEVDGDSTFDVHTLFSYFTAKYGEIKDLNEVKDELDELWNEAHSMSEHNEEERKIIKVKEKVKRLKEVHVNNQTVGNYNIGTGNTTWEEVEEIHEKEKVIVTHITKVHFNNIEDILKSRLDKDQLEHYEILKLSKGNMEKEFANSLRGFLGAGTYVPGLIPGGPYVPPPDVHPSIEAQRVFDEAQKHNGLRYVFGGSSPSTGFDCSSFVCYVFSKSGVQNMPRVTADQIYRQYCDPISPEEARPGDIIFFHSTYACPEPISHVGIWVGGSEQKFWHDGGTGMGYSAVNSNGSMNNSYWRQHFYAFGRPKNMRNVTMPNTNNNANNGFTLPDNYMPGDGE